MLTPGTRAAIFPGRGWQNCLLHYQPIRTVNSPGMIMPPCISGSVMRAAGRPPTRTVIDPITIGSGGPTHNALTGSARLRQSSRE